MAAMPSISVKGMIEVRRNSKARSMVDYGYPDRMIRVTGPWETEAEATMRTQKIVASLDRIIKGLLPGVVPVNLPNQCREHFGRN